ncbi:MAG: tRNA (guanosine(46)-N7)-methyltransferase TrmB [Planctomycetota bacterium]
MSRDRTRQHANPLSFRAPVEIPRWSEVFPRPELPLEVDVGSAHGDFLTALAAQRPDCNYVGLELRRPMVERVQRRLEREELRNVHLVCCNANAVWDQLFAPSSLRRVFVHFPDPWFKTRHHKRRVLSPAFVDQLARTLLPGGELRFMTDFEAYALAVVEQLGGDARFENPHGPGRPAPQDPELPLTHREAWHMGRGDAIHRYVWRRRA